MALAVGDTNLEGVRAPQPLKRWATRPTLQIGTAGLRPQVKTYDSFEVARIEATVMQYRDGPASAGENRSAGKRREALG